VVVKWYRPTNHRSTIPRSFPSHRRCCCYGPRQSPCCHCVGTCSFHRKCATRNRRCCRVSIRRNPAHYPRESMLRACPLGPLHVSRLIPVHRYCCRCPRRWLPLVSSLQKPTTRKRYATGMPVAVELQNKGILASANP